MAQVALLHTEINTGFKLEPRTLMKSPVHDNVVHVFTLKFGPMHVKIKQGWNNISEFLGLIHNQKRHQIFQLLTVKAFLTPY